jgi:hypothetical protein
LANSSVVINEPLADNVFVASAGVDAPFGDAYALNGIDAYDVRGGSDLTIVAQRGDRNDVRYISSSAGDVLP